MVTSSRTLQTREMATNAAERITDAAEAIMLQEAEEEAKMKTTVKAEVRAVAVVVETAMEKKVKAAEETGVEDAIAMAITAEEVAVKDVVKEERTKALAMASLTTRIQVKALEMLSKLVDIAKDTKENHVNSGMIMIAKMVLVVEREATGKVVPAEETGEGNTKERVMSMKKRRVKKAKAENADNVNPVRKRRSRLSKRKRKKSDSLMMTISLQRRLTILHKPRAESTRN